MSSAREIAITLAGRRAQRLADGSYLIPCPVPSHGKGRGDRNPSLRIGDGQTRLLVHCYGGCDRLDVLADAQQERVYFQPFARAGDLWRPVEALTILPVAEWHARRRPDAWATGPGLKKWEARLAPEVRRVDEALRDPQPASLLRLGLARYRAGERDDIWSVEPLYLRPSSAEEQWRARPS